MGSYETYDFVRSSKINDLPQIKLDKQGVLGGYLPRNIVSWSEDLQEELIMFFTKCDYPFRNCEEIPFLDPLRSEIRRFFISLDAYIESSNPVIPYKDILYGATHKDYAKTLKRIKRKSLEKSWNAENFSLPDWWNDVPDYHIYDIGDIFNYSYLIFWEEDLEDDLKNGFIPVEISMEYLEKYKESLREILPQGGFSIIEPIEVLKTVSSSMSFDSKLGKFPHYKQKPNRLFFSREMKVCKRSQIRVSPCNTRDSVITHPEDLNTISLIDKQVMEILSKMKGHIHLRDKNEVNRRLFELGDKYSLFLHRDIKKEGITKPRELLKATLEVLREVYPNIDIFAYTTFYDSYCVEDINGDILFPDRGHGLGMANSLTTLMQLAVHNLIVDELADDIPDFKSGCLTLNDDFVVGFSDEYHEDEYWDKEDEVMKNLSILRAEEKSFKTKYRFVIAERYITPIGELKKESYQRRELLYPLTCYNISHAKDYFISAQTFTSSDFREEYIGEICSYWGYEFHPNELNYPYIIGGWINDTISGVDMSLYLLDKLDFNANVEKGYKASRYKSKIYKGGIQYRSPIFILFGEPYIPEEYKVHFDILSESEINQKYGRILKDSISEFKNYWDDQLLRRREIFRKEKSTLSYEELLKDICNTFKTTQFYPSEEMISHFVKGNYFQTNIIDYYIDPNPHLSLISLYNETSYRFKEDFSIEFCNADEFSKRTSALYSKEIQRSLKSKILNDYLIGRNDEIYYPEELEYNPQEQYLNPFSIGKIVSLYNWGYGYPVLKKEYEHPLIEKKKKVFGRLLNLEETILLSRYSIQREVVKQILELEIEIETALDFLVKIMLDEDKENKIQALNEKNQEEDEYRIGITDLLEPGVPKVWIYHQNPEGFEVDHEAKEILEDLLTLIVILSWGGFHNPAQCIFQLERFEQKSGVHKFILDNSNIRNIGSSILDSDEGEDDPLSLLFG